MVFAAPALSGPSNKVPALSGPSNKVPTLSDITCLKDTVVEVNTVRINPFSEEGVFQTESADETGTGAIPQGNDSTRVRLNYEMVSETPLVSKTLNRTDGETATKVPEKLLLDVNNLHLFAQNTPLRSFGYGFRGTRVLDSGIRGKTRVLIPGYKGIIFRSTSTRILDSGVEGY